MQLSAAPVEDVGGRLVALCGTNHVWRDAVPGRFERQAAEGKPTENPHPHDALFIGTVSVHLLCNT